MADTWGLSWLLSWGGSWGRSAQPAPTKGYSEQDLRKYRKYLERLAKVTEGKTVSAKVQEIAEEIVEAIPLEIPQIENIAHEHRIDFDALLMEIGNVRSFIEQKIQYEKFLREQDDELAILLLM